MKILTHKKFDKAFKKVPTKLQKKVFEQLEVLQKHPADKRLNNHTLSGEYFGYRSINIESDWRIIFKEMDTETVRLMDIGTHSQLYG